MKHTLKSLLITSVLTLPTVLGSDIPGSDALDNQDDPGGSQTNAQTQSPLHGLILRQKDVLEICLIGLIDNDKFTLGSPSLRDLYALSRVSQGMHKLVQPILDFVKKWTETDPIVRLLQDKCTPEDETVFPLFVHSRTKFDRLVEILFSRFNSRVLIKDKRALAQLINNSGFTDAQKIILIGGLPNATVWETWKAADGLHKLGDLYPEDSNERKAYHEKAAKLYVQASTRDDAAVWDILLAADGLCKTGHPEEAAKLYVRAANHNDATVEDILKAADKVICVERMYEVGSPQRMGFHEMAAILYGKVSERDDATVFEILWAADGVLYLAKASSEGSTEYNGYLERVAALYVRTSMCNDATIEHILWAADRLRALRDLYKEGSIQRNEHHSSAAALYVQASTRDDAKVEEILSAADGLRTIGDLYPEDSSERKLYHERAANASAKLLKQRNY